MATITTKTGQTESGTLGTGLYGTPGTPGMTGSGAETSSTHSTGPTHGTGSTYGSGSSSYGAGSIGGASGGMGGGQTSGSKSGMHASGTSSSSSRSSESHPNDNDDNSAQLRRMVDGSREIASKLQGTMEERPVAALLGVAGVSFVAGSLLGSRIGQLALAVGLGYAAANLFRGEGGLRGAIDQFSDNT